MDLPIAPSQADDTLTTENLKQMLNPATLDTYAVLSNSKGFIQFPNQTQNVLLQTQSSFGQELKQLRASPSKLKVHSIAKFKPVIDRGSRNVPDPYGGLGKLTKVSKTTKNSEMKEPRSPRLPTTLRK